MNIEIPKDIIGDLLTPSEIRMLKIRVLIMSHIAEGKSVRDISFLVGVGTDTVVRMTRKLEGSETLQDWFIKKVNSSSKWIFGKVSSEEK